MVSPGFISNQQFALKTATLLGLSRYKIVIVGNSGQY